MPSRSRSASVSSIFPCGGLFMNQPSTPSDKPRTRIDRILFVAEIPLPNERDPHTLYIPQNEGVPERDQHLGAFMNQWSNLERAMLMLLWPLLEGKYTAAEVLFHSTTNIKSHTDMITGLVALKYKQQATKWRKLASRCLTLSNNRNHLVHGYWIPKAVVGGDDEGRPIVKRIKWYRVYMTGDPELNARATTQTDEPRTGQHRYALERIRHKISQIATLTQDIDAFKNKVFGTAPPLR